MRIGMMADAYKPHVSGVTNVIALSKRFLELAGYEIYVFTFGGGDYEDDEPNIVRTRGMPLVDTGLYFSARHSSEAQKLISKMDILHVHHPFTSGQLAIRYSRAQGIPLVFTNHTRYDLYAHAYLPMVPEALGDAFLKAYLPSFCKSCDLVIAPSPGLQEVLIELGVEAPIEVIPNGVDIGLFKIIEKQKEPIPKNLKPIFDKPTVINVARYCHRAKDQQSLIELTCKIKDAARMVFVGMDRGHKQTLIELAKERGLKVFVEGDVVIRRNVDTWWDKSMDVTVIATGDITVNSGMNGEDDRLVLIAFEDVTMKGLGIWDELNAVILAGEEFKTQGYWSAAGGGGVIDGFVMAKNVDMMGFDPVEQWQFKRGWEIYQDLGDRYRNRNG